MKTINTALLLSILVSCQFYQFPFSKNLENKAAEIHKNVLTLDTHTDTPLTFMHSDFDLTVRHDPYETRTCLDFPRMKEGQLDAVFFAAFIAQGDRDSSGNLKARDRTMAILKKIHSEIKAHQPKPTE